MVIILLADGFEELEALTPVDVLRRELTDLPVKTVGVTGKHVRGAHGITVECDLLPEDVDLTSLIAAVFPGGMPGATNLDASHFTDKVIDAVLKNRGVLGAICAAPLVLGRRGLLEGKSAVCFPGFESELHGAKVQSDARVVVSDDIITARDFRASFDFADRLSEKIKEKLTR